LALVPELPPAPEPEAPLDPAAPPLAPSPTNSPPHWKKLSEPPTSKADKGKPRMQKG
jgi:hypothetical protein